MSISFKYIVTHKDESCTELYLSQNSLLNLEILIFLEFPVIWRLNLTLRSLLIG